MLSLASPVEDVREISDESVLFGVGILILLGGLAWVFMSDAPGATGDSDRDSNLPEDPVAVDMRLYQPSGELTLIFRNPDGTHLTLETVEVTEVDGQSTDIRIEPDKTMTAETIGEVYTLDAPQQEEGQSGQLTVRYTYTLIGPDVTRTNEKVLDYTVSTP